MKSCEADRYFWRQVARSAANLILVLCLIPALLAGGQGAVQKLTLEQIEGLIAHGVPDSTMSAQIQAHGLAFTPTQETMEELRGKGAGPLTLARVQALLASGRAATPGGGKPGASPKAASKITRSQLEQALRGHSPDATLASQIRTRGVAFPVAGRTVDELGGKGAGPQTLAALREQIISGTLQIHSEPQASITLDGAKAGVADASGSLAVSDVLPGHHDVIARCDGFKEGRANVALGDRESKQLSMPLEWLGGFLDVTASPADTLIVFSGAKCDGAAGAQFEARCMPGSYQLRALAEGYKTEDYTFQIATGDHQALHINLKVDPGYIAAKVADAKRQLASGQLPAAMDSAGRVLKVSPDDASAKEILAEAAFQTGDTATFERYALTTIRGGGSVSVSLMHVHNFPHRMVHLVNATISSTGIALAPATQGVNCKMPQTVNFDTIASAQVGRDPTGTLQLHIVYGSKPRGQSRGIGVAHDLDLVAAGSAVVTGTGRDSFLGGNNVPIGSPPNAVQILQSLSRLISSLGG